MDAEIVENGEFIVGDKKSSMEFGTAELVEVRKCGFDDGVSGGTDAESDKDFIKS